MCSGAGTAIRYGWEPKEWKLSTNKNDDFLLKNEHMTIFYWQNVAFVCLKKVSRKNFYRTFTEHWPSGRGDMVVWSYYHYEIGNIFNAETALDVDGD